MKLHAHLTRLVIAALAPAALATALLIAHSYDRQKTLVEEDTVATARALTQAVDRQLDSAAHALSALATSPNLASGDLGAFHAQAREAMRALPGNNIVLSDLTGQQVLNTLRDYGEPLPMHGNLAQLHRVVEAGRPLVSDLFVGAVVLRPVIAVEIPVRRDGRVAYVLSLGFFSDQLGAILHEQHLPEGWIGAIFDSHGTVVARTHDPERYVGRKGAAALVRSLAEMKEGQVETDTLEGIPVVSVFSRSGISNWSVAIGVPRAMFAAQLRSSLVPVVPVTVLLVALGVLLAQMFAGRIRRDLRALVPAAAALARGEAVQVRALHLDEADEVARALGGASRILRDREEILAVVAHDLRSPLSGIVMVAETAQRQALQGDGERLGASAAIIAETARGMSGLVDDLLAVTVAQRGQSMLHIVPVPAAQLVASAVQKARPAIERAGLALETHLPNGLPEVQVDMERILRVFANLLDNALKFTRAPGRVVVGAESQAASVRFFVANTGASVGREVMDSMFQVFWQARADHRGSGLGLSISRSIVETHGGRIWAEPQEGMCVRICIELPRAAPAQEGAQTPTPG